MGVRADGKYGALHTRKILRKGVSLKLGQYYRDHLRQKLALEFPELKFPTINITNGTSFRIIGCHGEEIPNSLIRQLSSRRAAIEEACKQNPSKAKHVIAVETRDRKVEAVDQEEFFAKHKKIAKEHGFNVEAFLTRSRQHHRVITTTKAVIAAMAEEAQYRTIGGFTKPIKQKRTGKPNRQPLRLEHRQKVHTKKGPPSSKKIKSLIETILQRYGFQIVHDLNLAFERENDKQKRKEQQWQRKPIGHRLLDKYLPQRPPSKKTKLDIEFQFWTGRITLSQRLYLRHKYEYGLPKYFMPKSRLSINLAYATRQITRKQQLLLLKHFDHLHKRSPEIRTIIRTDSPKRK